MLLRMRKTWQKCHLFIHFSKLVCYVIFKLVKWLIIISNIKPILLQLWVSRHQLWPGPGLLLDTRELVHPCRVPAPPQVYRGAGGRHVCWRGPGHLLLPVGHLHVLYTGTVHYEWYQFSEQWILSRQPCFICPTKYGVPWRMGSLQVLGQKVVLQ